MERSIRYEFKRSKKYILGLMFVCLLAIIGLTIVNINTKPTSIVGNISYFNNLRYLSIVQSCIIIIIVSLIIRRFNFIYQSLPLNIAFSISRTDFFKTIIFESITTSAMLSIFLGVCLKIEPLFIEKIIVNKENVMYLDKIGKMSITDTNIFLLIFNIFFLLLSIIAFWNIIVIIIYSFKAKGVLFLLALSTIKENFLKENEYMSRLVSIMETFSIENISDGILDIKTLLYGLVHISIMYTLTYILIKNITIRGE